MDGLKDNEPLGVPKSLVEQLTLFNMDEEQEERAPRCKVHKWRMRRGKDDFGRYR